MKRWHANLMQTMGKTLFTELHRQKKHAHHNHKIHYMARDRQAWLPNGIQAMIDGSYDPRPLKQYYFSDETVVQPHLSDRIFQPIFFCDIS